MQLGGGVPPPEAPSPFRTPGACRGHESPPPNPPSPLLPYPGPLRGRAWGPEVNLARSCLGVGSQSSGEMTSGPAVLAQRGQRPDGQTQRAREEEVPACTWRGAWQGEKEARRGWWLGRPCGACHPARQYVPGWAANVNKAGGDRSVSGLGDKHRTWMIGVALRATDGP